MDYILTISLDCIYKMSVIHLDSSWSCPNCFAFFPRTWTSAIIIPKFFYPDPTILWWFCILPSSYYAINSLMPQNRFPARFIFCNIIIINLRRLGTLWTLFLKFKYFKVHVWPKNRGHNEGKWFYKETVPFPLTKLREKNVKNWSKH